MPKRQLDLVNLVGELCGRYEHAEAERLLHAALKEDPRQPDLWAELGILYCWTQREAMAVDLLGRSKMGLREATLAKFLLDHFECRRSMAKKLKRPDREGASLLKRARAVARASAVASCSVGLKLSACLIVKNEEAHLDRCLASLRGLVDETIVIDTGSSDRTVEIAQKHGALIGHFDWCDDFSAARNESLRRASGDWVLWIDADEELDPRSFAPIREGLMRPQFGGFYVQIDNFMDDKGEVNKYVHSPVRLFQRRPGVGFCGRVHEQVTPSLSKLGLPNATLEGALIKHYGYRPSEMESKGKIRRTLDLLQTQVREEPEEAFHWFNLANAHTVDKNYEAAACAAVECIARLDSRNAFGSLTYQLLQTALIELGRPEEALDRCDEAGLKGFAGILTEFERAHALSRLGRFDAALESIDHCLKLDWPQDLTGDYSIFTHKRHLLKGQILAQLGRYDEALGFLDFVLAVDPNSGPAICSKAAVLEKLCDFESALSLYERVLASESHGRTAHRGAARAHLALAHPGEAARLAEAAWRIGPQDRETWVLWVSCCEAAGDQESAARAYEDFGRHFEPVPEIMVNWGRVLVKLGKHEAALACYREAIELTPSDSNAYFNAGDLLYGIGEYQEAANVYQAGLHLAPESAQAWFVLGNCLARLCVVKGAVLAYEQALAIDSSHAEAATNLSLVQSAA